MSTTVNTGWGGGGSTLEGVEGGQVLADDAISLAAGGGWGGWGGDEGQEERTGRGQQQSLQQ